MKIGILTYHMADNYGAVLQAYALQQALFQLGMSSEILSTDFPDPEEKPQQLSGAAAILMRRVQQEEKKRKELFQQFRDQYLRCSAPYLRSELEKADPLYTLFMTGSDQVWNLRVLGADRCYFLPFTEAKKRTSYAASFGGEEIPETSRNWCEKELKEFARLSVREKSGQEYLKKLTGKESSVCLDPTLLLERKDWEKLVNTQEMPPYYLLYMLKYDEELERRAKQKADETGAGLKVISGSFLPRFGFDAWSRVGITDWLTLMKNAEGVFTNSFHGTVFSLIFGRPLSVAKLGGNLSGRNGRIEELLDLCGLSDAYNGALCPLPEGEFEIKLEPAKKASIAYLEEIKQYAGTL